MATIEPRREHWETMERSRFQKSRIFGAWTVLVLAVWATACSSNQSLFVLMPDHDGEVGSIEVSNPQGGVTLTEAGQTAQVKSATSRVVVADEAMSDEEIQEAFGAALAAEPQPPRVFVIYFASDSSALDDTSLTLLDEVIKEISGRDSMDVSVNGHSDRTGDADHNRELSLERGEAVREQLVARGAAVEQISVDYQGEGDPLIPTADGVAEPRNRRVEVIVR